MYKIILYRTERSNYQFVLLNHLPVPGVDCLYDYNYGEYNLYDYQYDYANGDYDVTLGDPAPLTTEAPAPPPLTTPRSLEEPQRPEQPRSSSSGRSQGPLSFVGLPSCMSLVQAGGR